MKRQKQSYGVQENKTSRQALGSEQLNTSEVEENDQYQKKELDNQNEPFQMQEEIQEQEYGSQSERQNLRSNFIKPTISLVGFTSGNAITTKQNTEQQYMLHQTSRSAFANENGIFNISQTSYHPNDFSRYSQQPFRGEKTLIEQKSQIEKVMHKDEEEVEAIKNQNKKEESSNLKNSKVILKKRQNPEYNESPDNSYYQKQSLSKDVNSQVEQKNIRNKRGSKDSFESITKKGKNFINNFHIEFESEKDRDKQNRFAFKTNRQCKQFFTSTQKIIIQQEIACNLMAIVGLGICQLVSHYQKYDEQNYVTLLEIIQAILLVLFGIIGFIAAWFGMKEKDLQSNQSAPSQNLKSKFNSLLFLCSINPEKIKFVIIFITSSTYVLLLEIDQNKLGVIPTFFAFFQIIIFYEISVSFLPELFVRIAVTFLLIYAFLRKVIPFEQEYFSSGIITMLSLIYTFLKMRMISLSPFLFSSQLNSFSQQILLNSGIVGNSPRKECQDEQNEAQNKRNINQVSNSQMQQTTTKQMNSDDETKENQHKSKYKHAHIKKKIYQDILNVIPEGVALINESNQLVYANKTLLEILGCPKTQVASVLMGLATKTNSEDLKKNGNSSQIIQRTHISNMKSFQSLNNQTSSQFNQANNIFNSAENSQNNNINNLQKANTLNANPQKIYLPNISLPGSNQIIPQTSNGNILNFSQANNNSYQPLMASAISPQSFQKITDPITPKASPSKPSIFNRHQRASMAIYEGEKFATKLIEEFNQKNVKKSTSLPLNQNFLNCDFDLRKYNKNDDKKITCIPESLQNHNNIEQLDLEEQEYSREKIFPEKEHSIVINNINHKNNSNNINHNNNFNSNQLGNNASNSNNNQNSSINQQVINNQMAQTVITKKTNEQSDGMSISNYFNHQNGQNTQGNMNSDSASINEHQGNIEKLQVDFMRYQKTKKFKNTEVIRKDISVKEILASIFENMKQDSDSRTAKTFKLQHQSSDLRSSIGQKKNSQQFTQQLQHQYSQQSLNQNSLLNTLTLQQSLQNQTSNQHYLTQASNQMTNLQNQTTLQNQQTQNNYHNQQITNFPTNKPNRYSPKREDSFVSQMKRQTKIGYFQYINDTIKVEVEYKNSKLVLNIVMCQIVKNNTVEQLALILVDTLWQEMYEKKLVDMQSYRMKMFASLSHELRTPLNCSISMLQQLKSLLNENIYDPQKVQEVLTIKDKIKQKLNSKNEVKKKDKVEPRENMSKENIESYIQEYIDPALNSNSLLLNLINDILDFVQIDSGKFKFLFIKFDLEQLLSNCIQMVGIQSKQHQKKVELCLKYDENCPKSINSDPNRIRQVILNFLSNALKFTSAGCITLSATLINHNSYESPSIYTQDLFHSGQGSLDEDDMTNYQNNIIEISVEDQGIGISQEEITNIFTVFNKIDLGNKKTLNTQGCGLGLTISNSIAKGLGPSNKGGVRVLSEKGKGSIFSILVEDKSIEPLDHKLNISKDNLPAINKMDTINSNDSPNSYNTTNLIKKQSNSFPQKITIQEDFCTIKKQISGQSRQDNLTPKNQKSISGFEESCLVVDTEPKKVSIQNFTASVPYQIQQNQDFPLQNEVIEAFGSSDACDGNILIEFNNRRPLYKQKSMTNKITYSTKTLHKIYSDKKDQQDANISYHSVKSQQKFPRKYSPSCSQSKITFLTDPLPYSCSPIPITNSNQIGIKQDMIKSFLFNSSPLSDALDNKTQMAQQFAFKFSKTTQEIPSYFSSSEKNISCSSNHLIEVKNLKEDLIDIKLKMLYQNPGRITEDFSKNEECSTKKNVVNANTSLEIVTSKKKCEGECSQILVVDDNNFNIYAIKMQLQKYGFKIEQASNGQEAVDMVKDRFQSKSCCKSYLLIFMDIEMPVKNGYTASEEIRQYLEEEEYKGKQPIIIACTAYVSDEDKDRAIEHKMDDFIKKPVFQEGLDLLFEQWFSEMFDESQEGRDDQNEMSL